MSTNKRQAEQEAQQTAWRETIEQSNDTMRMAADAAKTRFEQPLVINARNADHLARQLSERYNGFRFTISYVSGKASVYATPFHHPSSTEGYLENIAKTAAETAAAVETHWASFDTVRGWAQGYDHGLGDRRDLEEKIQSLKERGGSGFPFHPAMMFSGPWGYR